MAPPAEDVTTGLEFLVDLPMSTLVDQQDERENVPLNQLAAKLRHVVASPGRGENFMAWLVRSREGKLKIIFLTFFFTHNRFSEILKIHKTHAGF